METNLFCFAERGGQLDHVENIKKNTMWSEKAKIGVNQGELPHHLQVWECTTLPGSTAVTNNNLNANI